ncbi:MAG: protein translocase subunit SecD [Melioribacteraceae bacterium]|nr:protein translocase subunit SecD [Melioribacteraceae bacterium]
MKEFRFRIIVILAALGLGVYLLFPTYADYQNSKEITQTLSVFSDSVKKVTPTISEADLDNMVELKEETIRVSDPSIKEAREKRIKLGLDLQGGMYLVMEVNTSELLMHLAKDADKTFEDLLALSEQEAIETSADIVTILAQKLQENNIRLSRYFGSIREDDAEIIDRLKDQELDAVTRAVEVIGNRVNQYGVSEPSIQKQGARRIIVELPGVAKEEEAKKLLEGSALLQFTMVKDANFSVPLMNSIDGILAKSLTADTTAASDDSVDVADMTEAEFNAAHPFFAIARISAQSPEPFVKEDDKAKVLNYLERPEVKNVIPDNVEFKFSAKPAFTQDGINYFTLFLLNKTPELTGGVVDAQANISPETTEPIVNMQMNPEASREWARITGANINKRCAIVLDGFVYQAPNIIGKIPGGRSQISGMDDMDEAKLMEIVLKAGALPASVTIIEERTVGPSLGQDSINQGLNSTLIGFFFVAVFMLIYYKKAGSIADVALGFTIIFIMGILAAFHATLTLPGIAGIILTIGMAVDANVLIFERIREEMGTGKTVKASIESGYLNSYSAIFDSNITTFFIGIILYQFGSGPIQGFALTLMIGIVCSLFSALVVTRVIFDLMVFKGTKVNIG